MKKIQIDFFGKEEEIYFNISRLMEVEKLTGQSIGEIINNQNLDLKNISILLMVGLKHTGVKRTVLDWAKMLQDAIEDGVEISEIQIAVTKALIGSGILGKAAYYQIFPEELTKEEKEEIEKN